MKSYWEKSSMLVQKILLLCITFFSLPNLCSTHNPRRSTMPLLNLKSVEKQEVVPYEQATFLVVYDHACAVHAKLYDSRLIAVPKSIALQMNIENYKIALAEKHAGRAFAKNMSFIVYANGSVVNLNAQPKKLNRTDSNFSLSARLSKKK